MASSDDLGDLLRIENAAFTSDRISRRSFRRLIAAPTATILVSQHDGESAGYALILTRSKSPHARLYSLAVHPSYAGQGLGAELLRACERSAKARNALSLRLEVRTDNRPAIALYRAHGYAQIGAVPRYYVDGQDAYRFSKTL